MEKSDQHVKQEKLTMKYSLSFTQTIQLESLFLWEASRYDLLLVIFLRLNFHYYFFVLNIYTSGTDLPLSCPA